MVANIINLIQQYGLFIVFANVFCEQIGLPVPAYPTLLVTGALLTQGNYSAVALLLIAVSGALIADFFWFFSGRKYGNKVMAKLCKISLSPDSCVRQTESIYLRTGPATLLFCKFIPGLSTVSSALAGTLGTNVLTFLVFDALGAALWAGSAILLGTLFSNAIDDLLNVLVQMGKWGGLLIALGLAAFIASKWWQRHRFLKSLRMAQISVSELNRMLSGGLKPTIIDVRPLHLQDSGIIPGAIAVSIEKVDTVILDASVDDEIILYCACPNEVTSAKVAKMLMKKGYKRVRPLTGGIDAWVNAGHPTAI
ncbi:MAG TPA: DedA family protein/thiosulfate sulfurtransferase GlpE [Methylophilaceae bacterium]|jgi:membrane protein DedA with SNARE-associated domain/rhodanese-related sulfurtransferase